eukprot:scaffold108084_cov29-Tisochrysis_lutea.AAC.4
MRAAGKTIHLVLSTPVVGCRSRIRQPLGQPSRAVAVLPIPVRTLGHRQRIAHARMPAILMGLETLVE